MLKSTHLLNLFSSALTYNMRKHASSSSSWCIVHAHQRLCICTLRVVLWVWLFTASDLIDPHRTRFWPHDPQKRAGPPGSMKLKFHCMNIGRTISGNVRSGRKPTNQANAWTRTGEGRRKNSLLCAPLNRGERSTSMALQARLLLL